MTDYRDPARWARTSTARGDWAATALGAGLVSALVFVAAYRMSSHMLAAAGVTSAATALVALSRVMLRPEVASERDSDRVAGPTALGSLALVAVLTSCTAVLGLVGVIGTLY